MKKIFGFYFLFIFISGCVTGSIDYSTEEINNSAMLKTAKNWKIVYDTVNAVIITTDFLGGSSVTKYPDSMSMIEFLDEPYVVAEARQKKLSENIRLFMKSKISDDGEGVIKISNLFYKDNYIFHCLITFYDKNGIKIAELTEFNKCEYDGRYTVMSKHALHDYAFAKYCAENIFRLIGR